MDRERRIELEVKAAIELAGIYIAENCKFFGEHRRSMMADIPHEAASFAHELVDHVLRNNLENLSIDER